MKLPMKDKSGDTGGIFGVIDGNNPAEHTELPMTIPPDQPSPSFTRDTDLEGYVLDSNCIAWMFEKAVDADLIMVIMRFIPEVVWHYDIQTTPLDELYKTLLGCFDHSSGHPVVIQKLRDTAYLNAKAVLHLVIQRRCFGNESDMVTLKFISENCPIMGVKQCEGYSDLESTLGIIDCIFGSPKPLHWQGFSLSTPHHTWMSHILLYHAFDVQQSGKGLPDYIVGFIDYSIHLKPSPPMPIIMDCFFLIGSLLGVKLDNDTLLAVDKR